MTMIIMMTVRMADKTVSYQLLLMTMMFIIMITTMTIVMIMMIGDKTFYHHLMTMITLVSNPRTQRPKGHLHSQASHVHRGRKASCTVRQPTYTEAERPAAHLHRGRKARYAYSNSVSAGDVALLVQSRIRRCRAAGRAVKALSAQNQTPLLLHGGGVQKNPWPHRQNLGSFSYSRCHLPKLQRDTSLCIHGTNDASTT